MRLSGSEHGQGKEGGRENEGSYSGGNASAAHHRPHAFWCVTGTRLGTLRAVRENPRRARFIGINVRRHQLLAFGISGVFSGLAGGLFAFYNGSVFPDFAYFTKSFEPLVVALLGGVQSFFGPLAGAFGFKVLEWLISRQWPIYWPLFLGAIVIAVIVVLPQGFVGLVGGRLWTRPADRS